MHLSFRWYCENDPISLTHIRQIPGMVSIVAALYDVPPGQLWPRDRLQALRQQIEDAGLCFEVVESLPVHEDIKLGRDNRDDLIDVYCENIKRLGEIGVSVICYNFMPLFDWMRTDMAWPLPDGSTVMHYDHEKLAHIRDPWGDELPAYFPLDEPADALKAAYLGISEGELWDNLAYFLEGVMETAVSANVKLAIHPDDPPWPIFGLPRIIKDETSLAKLLSLVDSPANGLTFCTGSLDALPNNDLPKMFRRFGSRIYFAHSRNVKTTGFKQFHEVAHPVAYGDIDLPTVMKAYHDIKFSGPMRPDHGRMIWDETGLAGYGLYDRALGATYLLGLWDSLQSNR